MHIDGKFDGDVNSQNIVEIGKSGVMNGEVKAKMLVVVGRFLGNAECDSIELVSGGAAEGKLLCANLVIDANSSFEGESLRMPTDKGTAEADLRKNDGAPKGNPFKGSAMSGAPDNAPGNAQGNAPGSAAFKGSGPAATDPKSAADVGKDDKKLGMA